MTTAGVVRARVASVGSPAAGRLDAPAIAVIALTAGYLGIWRSFAYFGVPSIGLYIGEIALVVSVVHPRTRRAYAWAVRRLLSPGEWHLLMTLGVTFVAFGIAQAVRGVAAGHSALYAIRNLPFNYYLAFLVIGLAVAAGRPKVVPAFAQAYGVFNAI